MDEQIIKKYVADNDRNLKASCNNPTSSQPASILAPKIRRIMSRQGLKNLGVQAQHNLQITRHSSKMI